MKVAANSAVSHDISISLPWLPYSTDLYYTKDFSKSQKSPLYRKTRLAVPKYQARSTEIPGLQYRKTRLAVPQNQACSTEIPGLQYRNTRLAVPKYQACSTAKPGLQYRKTRLAVPKYQACNRFKRTQT